MAPGTGMKGNSRTMQEQIMKKEDTRCPVRAGKKKETGRRKHNWDITSPAKPAVVRGRRGRLIAVDEPLKAEPQASCKNAVFLLSPCPHTRAQLQHFTASTEDIGLQQLMDKLLPKGLQNIVSSKRVTLYWLDVSDWAQVWDSCDHFGYWKMVELMQLVGGRILPSECLLESAFQQVLERPDAHEKLLKIPCDSVLNSLISNEWEMKNRFPQKNGTLYFTAAGGIETCECAVSLEPVSACQKQFKSLIKISLKGTIQNWNWHQMGRLTLDTWVLQNVSDNCLLFQQLLSAAMSKELLLIADVCTEDDLSLNTGILSPISQNAAILSVLRNGESFRRYSSHLEVTEDECSKEISADLPDIVNSVLHHVYSTDESIKSPNVVMPEWIKQELSQSSHWSSSVVERWYPITGTSGASSNLMESFRLISAASFDQDEQRYDQDITHHLSECYQKKTSEESGSVAQSDNQRKRLRCQIQALLRLEMCVQCPSLQTNEDELEQVVEEVTDMLRIISLTEDPSFLTKFLATVLTEYIGSIPKILSDIYFSLGTQIPEELALVLPSDGDDSFLREGKTPMYSQLSISRVPSVPQVLNEEDQLEELRTRSAKKRRTSTLARHRSIAESSQTLRQIEIPKKHAIKETINLNPVIMVEKLKLPMQAQPQKEAEATKVRRNLFVQENRSPSRKSRKMPRSQSVSAVEGMKHKRSKTHDGTRDHHKLLTKKVMETPVHKQIANRLLHRQIKGRCSEAISDITIVEESPEKDIKDLRRSPRIKRLSLTRRNSSFYASQPKSRNLERVHSASQQQLLAADNKGSLQSAEAKTPKRLLFGEVLGLTSPPLRKARRKLLSEPEHSTQKMPEKHPKKTPRKTPQKAASNGEESLGRRLSQKSPRTPKSLKTPSKSPLEKKSAKHLGKFFSPTKIEKNTLKSPERRSERLLQMTPRKSDSPNKWLRSPLKALNQHVTPQKGIARRSLEGELFKSPEKTPKRCSNTNTPGNQVLHTSCTPRKSHRLQSSNSETATVSSYQLRTPQKSVPQTPTPKKSVACNSSVMLPLAAERTPRKHVADEDSMSPKFSFTTRYQLRTPQKSPSAVPQTPTPKKHMKWKNSVLLPLASESTPKKSDRSSRTAEEDSISRENSPFTSRYQLRTPQKSFSSVLQTPTPKKSDEWKRSVSITAEYTPKKSDGSHSMSTKTTPSFKTSALDILSIPLHPPVFKTPSKCQPSNNNELLLPGSKYASHGTKEFIKESTPDRCPLMSKHTSPVLSTILAAELKVVLPRLKNTSLNAPSSGGDLVLCEKLDGSSLESSRGSGSFTNTSQTDESIDIAEAKVVPTETCDLKMKLLITRKPSDASSLPGTPKGTGNLECASPYGLRHTVDRRQREAAARLGTPQIPSKFSTPKSQKKTVLLPTYEVQLEMRESGLPKLRFKRTDSNSTIDMTSGVRVEGSPLVPSTRKEDGPLGETWCNKHNMKLESGCSSPRLRSSYNTPGKSSLQTLICQSYTPKRCTSNTASPTQAEAASPWTPSPKYKDKNGSDVINNWPRKKKASAVKVGKIQKDKNQDHVVCTPTAEEEVLEQDTNKPSPLNDFVFDGISRLQENSPVISWKGSSEIETISFKSRKRGFEIFTPSKEAQPSSKRSCLISGEDLEECIVSSSLSSDLSLSHPSSTEDDVFSIAVITPPAKIPKNSLSASGLLTLTQSPMLFKGKTPSSKRKMQDCESPQSTPKQKRQAHQSSNPDDSPFSSSAPRPTISRTYTRKKLIT
ncbi:treslin [Pyxicephalus adspersus]|uniref:treslin n=1 Tax=Pyxicephalus adspersus TaxID=30357 RepID=UPI003B5C3ACE